MDCVIELDTSSLKSRTAVVTGSASDIVEAYTRALLSAACQVTISDLDTAAGERLTSEFPGKVHFVKCNVTNWDDQVKLFAEAADFSPNGKIAYVVANAGIVRNDEVFKYEEESGPEKPEMSTIDINITGTLYTSKLAMHYSINQNGTVPSDKQEDTCLVLIGSGAGIHDCLRIPQYSATKWAMRGIMRSLRRTSHYYGSRVNVIHPWYVKTKILSEEAFEDIKRNGVEFATAEDAGACLLRILSDERVNGHSLFVSARKWASSGYMDLGLEDTGESDLRREIQVDQMRVAPVEAGLFA